VTDTRTRALRQKEYRARAKVTTSDGRPAIPQRVDGTRTRQHLEQLRASGWTQAEIARETGLPESTLSGVRNNRWPKVARRVAVAILAVEPLPDPRDIVDPVVVERLCADPTAWRNGLTSTRAERLAAAHILGSWSHKALGYSGSDAKRGAA
jgi:transcriptional regulator with XRE-family HTH domain